MPTPKKITVTKVTRAKPKKRRSRPVARRELVDIQVVKVTGKMSAKKLEAELRARLIDGDFRRRGDQILTKDATFLVFERHEKP